LLIVSFAVGCQHAPASAPAPAPPAAASSTRAGAEFCAAQRADNRFRAEGSSCVADQDCVRVGLYETGTCDAWVTKPDAAQVLRQMRAAADAACRDMDRVQVAPACPPMVATCVVGRCAGKPTAGPFPVVAGAVQAIPEDFNCVANGLQRVTAEKKLPLGPVELRFPLAADGRPPHYFEAVSPHDPDAAVGVARALGTCRWRLQSGGTIPTDAWGSISITLKE
jgi:hypothetical protein